MGQLSCSALYRSIMSFKEMVVKGGSRDCRHHRIACHDEEEMAEEVILLLRNLL